VTSKANVRSVDTAALHFDEFRQYQRSTVCMIACDVETALRHLTGGHPHPELDPHRVRRGEGHGSGV